MARQELEEPQRHHPHPSVREHAGAVHRHDREQLPCGGDRFVADRCDAVQEEVEPALPVAIDPHSVEPTIVIAATATTIEPGAPVVLCRARILGGGGDNNQGRQDDVAPDGRFLINTVLDDAGSPITLIQPWRPPAR